LTGVHQNLIYLAMCAVDPQYQTLLQSIKFQDETGGCIGMTSPLWVYFIHFVQRTAIIITVVIVMCKSCFCFYSVIYDVV
jgi:hypothetical protein